MNLTSFTKLRPWKSKLINFRLRERCKYGTINDRDKYFFTVIKITKLVRNCTKLERVWKNEENKNILFSITKLKIHPRVFTVSL